MNRRSGSLVFRGGVLEAYGDLFSPEARGALAALTPLDHDRRDVMATRMARRRERITEGKRLAFLDPGMVIPGTDIRVQDARDGRFDGSEIPHDLQRQWIQGTGPATRPRATTEQGLRNVAYALLSGADGWMFDGEDALGQVDTMSLDNQRNLRLAIARDPAFVAVAAQVAPEMNRWANQFFGRSIIGDWRKQLDVTTTIVRARGLHLDDRHVRLTDGMGFSASIVDLVLYVTHNYRQLRNAGSSVVLYLPKIQTAAEAAVWNMMLAALEGHLELPVGTIKVYVLVEQVEACFQLMEIRAVLGPHFVGFNTGRWDYINSVADVMAGVPGFFNPNIDAIGMTYGYMRIYEDRVRRAVSTADRNGHHALWQGGMEANIPVGSEAGVTAGMAKAVAGARREQQAGASGKWVSHWKMVHIVRPVWEQVGETNQLGRTFPPLTYTGNDAEALVLLEPAPRTVRGARDLVSVAVQYGNAFGRGFQAAALKPADFFGNDDVLYLMEDAATGEIRMSILWEWLHKAAPFTEPDAETGVAAGDRVTAGVIARIVDEEYAKLVRASNRDVHDDSKQSTLPIARAILEAYVASDVKPPWAIDLWNLNLHTLEPGVARGRIRKYLEALGRENVRITENLDFGRAT